MTKKKVRRIIVEGPDCSGKSTLVERLKNELRWDSKSLHHINGSQYYRYLKEYTNQEKIVFDRSHFSENVYSKMWRGGTSFSKDEKYILNKVIEQDSIIIFSFPSADTIIKRYKERKFKQQISLPDLKRSYKYFMKEISEVNAIIYKSESYEELDILIKKVKETLK